MRGQWCGWVVALVVPRARANRIKTGMSKAQVLDLFVNKAAGVSWVAPAAPAAATAHEHAPQTSPNTTSDAGVV